jgi:hypothetical protein
MAAGPHLAGLGAALIVLLWTLDLLRRRQLREKYAALWLVVTVGVLSIGLFPGLLFWATRVLGFGLPVNLLFFVAALVELLVSIQLSLELGRRESESRRLGEELALLVMRVQLLEAEARSTGRSAGQRDVPEGEHVVRGPTGPPDAVTANRPTTLARPTVTRR